MQSKYKVAMVITSIWILAAMVTLSALVPVTVYDYESVTCGGIIYEGTDGIKTNQPALYSSFS